MSSHFHISLVVLGLSLVTSIAAAYTLAPADGGWPNILGFLLVVFVVIALKEAIVRLLGSASPAEFGHAPRKRTWHTCCETASFLPVGFCLFKVQTLGAEVLAADPDKFQYGRDYMMMVWLLGIAGGLFLFALYTRIGRRLSLELARRQQRGGISTVRQCAYAIFAYLIIGPTWVGVVFLLCLHSASA